MKYDRIIKDLWQAVGESLDLTELSENVGRVLLRELPARLVLLRFIEPEMQRIVTLSTFVSDRPARTAESNVDKLTPDQCREIVHWCRNGDILFSEHRSAEPILALVVPQGVSTPVLTTPLPGKHGTLGVLVLVSSGRAFTVRDKSLLSLLRAPLAAAAESGKRTQEVTRMKEAVEADRAALLGRLQRQDITETIVGATTGLREILAKCEQVAPTDVPVLILGETGSGKEVVAREIHKRSFRAAGPLVRVNCGAIPGELIDSELFGHEKGAFTGAVDLRKGWFERADGGILFLDEIGELPLAAQVRLLRILQDGMLERVGGQKSIHVDVRVVAATNRNLEEMVASGTFRQDLWFRINVFPIRLPPLRERKEDILSLSTHFVRRAAQRLGIPQPVITPEDLAALHSYHWPGNVRELSAVIDRAMILSDGSKGLDVRSALGWSRPAFQVAPKIVDSERTRSAETLEDAMKKHIESALRSTHGRVEGPFGAARVLQINSNTLRARMRKLGIDWRSFRSRT
jgi:hydrogenase-4 transcriptional activator